MILQVCSSHTHRRSQGCQRGHASPKFLENIVIVCFERRFSKQNSVIRLNSNILVLPNFLDWLRHCSHLTGEIVTVTKQALLSNSLPVPKSAADENFNHNYLIIKEDGFTPQLTLVMETAIHQIFFQHFASLLFKNAVLFINYMHTCLLIILFLTTFGH